MLTGSMHWACGIADMFRSNFGSKVFAQHSAAIGPAPCPSQKKKPNGWPLVHPPYHHIIVIYVPWFIHHAVSMYLSYFILDEIYVWRCLECFGFLSVQMEHIYYYYMTHTHRYIYIYIHIYTHIINGVAMQHPR